MMVAMVVVMVVVVVVVVAVVMAVVRAVMVVVVVEVLQPTELDYSWACYSKSSKNQSGTSCTDDNSAFKRICRFS